MILQAMLLTVMLGVAAPVSVEDEKETTTVKGQIFGVMQKQIMVMAGTTQHTFVIGPDTKISLDGSPVRLIDLKPGQAVQVASREEAGKKFAVSIDAKGMTGQPEPPTPRRSGSAR